MPALTGPAIVAAALLALAGAQKLVDPTMTVGALRALHLPSSAWLVRAGVRQFQVDTAVRPGGSWKSHVETGHVRAWRMLLDDASDRAAGRPTG